MGPRIDWKTIGGCAAVFGWLLLSSPGVKVVRAEDGPQSRVPVEVHGPACAAGPTAEEVGAFQAWMAEVGRQAAAETAAPPGGDAPIPLNNRGYNYGSPPGVDLTGILREVAER